MEKWEPDAGRVRGQWLARVLFFAATCYAGATTAAVACAEHKSGKSEMGGDSNPLGFIEQIEYGFMACLR